MAVVFISPKKRQKMFFVAIAIILMLFLVFIFIGVFFSSPEQVSQTLVFNKPKVNIDMNVFQSEQFKNLQDFTQMEIQFKYKAVTKDEKNVEGFISAVSLQAAKDSLEATGLTILEIQEAEIGRENPFSPYYQATVPTVPTTPTTKK